MLMSYMTFWQELREDEKNQKRVPKNEDRKKSQKLKNVTYVK